MNTQSLAKPTKVTELSAQKCNVLELKKRLISQKKKEIFQSRVIIFCFCLSLGTIGYFVIL